MKKLDKNALRKLIVETIEKDLNESKKKKGVKQELAGNTPVEADISAKSSEMMPGADTGGSIDELVANVAQAIEQISDANLKKKFADNLISHVKELVNQKLGIGQETQQVAAPVPTPTPEE